MDGITARVRGTVRRLDPITWPEPIAFLLFALIVIAPLLVGALLDSWLPISWLTIPAVGSLIWRIEGTRLRDIALLTVPMALVLLLAELYAPPPVWLVVSHFGVAFLLLMMFSRRFRERWYALVAPRYYRWLSPSDERALEQITDIDEAAGKTLRRVLRNVDAVHIIARLERHADGMRGLTLPDVEWDAIRSLWLSWLWRLAELLPAHDAPDDAFDELDRRRDAYVERIRALVAERSRPIGRPRTGAAAQG